MISPPFLVEMTVKATALLLAACAVRLLLRGASAASRQLLWTLAMLSLLLLPIFSIVLPAWSYTAPPPDRTVVVPPVSAAPIVAIVNLPPAPKRWVPEILLAIYFAGCAGVLLRLIVGSVRIAWIVRGASPFESGCPAPGVLAVQSDRVSLPVAWGWRRPVILLPAAARHWPRERLRLVFAHELAHIRRWDFPGQIAAHLACALYWFHPLAWWAMKQLVREREQACDDEVLNMGFTGTNYAEHLIQIARAAGENARSCLPAVGMAQASNLAARLEAMLDARLNRRAPGPSLKLASAAAALCLLLPIAAMHAGAQPSGAALRGVIRDPSRAVVPNAIVRATNADARNIEEVYSGPDGAYQFASLPAGHYTIEVRSPGFEVFQGTGIAVTAGSTAQFDVAMRVGAIKETVKVIGRRPATMNPPAPTGGPQRIRVGGIIQASKLLNKVQPVYPDSALQRGIQGIVLLQAVIGTKGQLLSLAPASASSDPGLTAAALDAVRYWTYEPTLLNGEPVEVVTTITVDFRLQ